MDSKEFVTLLRNKAVDENLKTHKQLLETTQEPKELVWKDFLPVYHKLNDDERNAFLNFLRLVEVNTLSIIFGVLDGSTYLSKENVEFILTTSASNEQINGELQDLFLELEE